MIEHPDFIEHNKRMKGLEKAPLRITCELLEGAVAYHPIHLDAILAFAVVERCTQGAGLMSSDFYDIDLPIETAGQSSSGARLFQSTDLIPVHNQVDVRYMHRRALDPRMADRNLLTGKGRHKEKRTALPVISGVLVADVVGNAEAIAGLLSGITHIGKKHSTSGRVRTWHIKPIDKFVWFDDDGKARRPIPVDYLNIRSDGRRYMGFTAPYWHADAMAYCVGTGEML